MFTVLDPLLEFTYHLLFSWRKFALCIQSLLCMLFFFGWPPCQRSDMILMEVSQHAFDMIHNISGLFDYFYVCEIYVNLIWYLYLFMLNKFCLSLSLSLSLSHCPACRTSLIATRFWVVMICPIIKCLTVLEFSFILFDLCLFITIFNFILNYVPIVTFWIFTYHKIWILLIIFCFIWSYWIIYFLTCLGAFWSVVS